MDRKSVFLDNGNVEFLSGRDKIAVPDEDAETLIEFRTPEDVVANFGRLLGQIGHEYLGISKRDINRATDIQARHFALIKAAVPNAMELPASDIETVYETHKDKAQVHLDDCRKHIARGRGVPSHVLSISRILSDKTLAFISPEKKYAMLLAQAGARIMRLSEMVDDHLSGRKTLAQSVKDSEIEGIANLAEMDMAEAAELPQFAHVGLYHDEPDVITGAQAANHLCHMFVVYVNKTNGHGSFYHEPWRAGYKQFYTDAFRVEAHRIFSLAKQSFALCKDNMRQAITDLDAVQENISRRLDITMAGHHQAPSFDVIVDVLRYADALKPYRELLEQRQQQVLSSYADLSTP